MNATALEQRVYPYLALPAGLQRLVVPVTLEEDEPTRLDDFQSWEFHSELVLVDPELRRRSLEFRPELGGVHRRTGVSRSPGPEPKVGSTPARAALRFGLHRVGKMTRLGLTVVGSLFTLAMLAELLPR